MKYKEIERDFRERRRERETDGQKDRENENENENGADWILRIGLGCSLLCRVDRAFSEALGKPVAHYSTDPQGNWILQRPYASDYYA